MKNKLQLMFCFTSLAVICLFFVSTHAQSIGDRNRPADSNSGRHNIMGRVYLPDGSPARGVTVSISSADSLPISLVTDNDGVFQTGSINAGNYTVAAKVEGYPQESESFTIALDEPQGRTVSVVLHIREPGQKKGDIYSANPMFKEVPKTALEKFKKGMDKERAGDTKGAISLLQAAVTEYPGFAAAYYELGHAYVKMSELDKGLESLVKAIEIKPDYTQAKFYVGYIHYAKNNNEVAAAIFDDVLKIKDTPDAHFYLGMSLAKLHQLDAALPHLKAALAKKDDVTTALAHRTLGGIYLQKKQNADAAAELQRYLELVPNAPDADKLKATIASLRK